MQRPYDAHGANAVIKITVFTPLLCVQCVDSADFAVNVAPAVQIGAAIFFVHIRVIGRDIDAGLPVLSGDFRQLVQQLSSDSLMTVRGKRIHEAAPRAEFRRIHAVTVGQRRKGGDLVARHQEVAVARTEGVMELLLFEQLRQELRRAPLAGTKLCEEFGLVGRSEVGCQVHGGFPSDGSAGIEQFRIHNGFPAIGSRPFGATICE